MSKCQPPWVAPLFNLDRDMSTRVLTNPSNKLSFKCTIKLLDIFIQKGNIEVIIYRIAGVLRQVHLRIVTYLIQSWHVAPFISSYAFAASFSSRTANTIFYRLLFTSYVFDWYFFIFQMVSENVPRIQCAKVRKHVHNTVTAINSNYVKRTLTHWPLRDLNST